MGISGPEKGSQIPLASNVVLFLVVVFLLFLLLGVVIIRFSKY